VELSHWLALFLAFGLSAMVAMRRAQHWPVALYLLVLGVCDAVPLAFDVGNGPHRLLWLTPGACFVALCGHVFRQPWAFGLAYALRWVAVGAVVWGVETETIHAVYSAQGAAGIVVALVAVVRR